jgi:hypothetical protein
VKDPTPPWKRRKAANGKARPLTPHQKEQARERARLANRRYPNLVDNMWAAKHVPPQAPSAPGDPSPLR